MRADVTSDKRNINLKAAIIVSLRLSSRFKDCLIVRGVASDKSWRGKLPQRRSDMTAHECDEDGEFRHFDKFDLVEKIQIPPRKNKLPPRVYSQKKKKKKFVRETNSAK